MKLDVVTQQGAVVRGLDAVELGLPGVVGQMGILPGHKAMIAGLSIGPMIVKDPDGVEHWFALNGGFVEVLGETVRVLSETCERADEIDVARAQASLAEAQQKLETLTPNDGEAYQVVLSSIRKQETRLKVASSLARNHK
jgi:F-type H+-transporting ATPase subunit epsilon